MADHQLVNINEYRLGSAPEGFWRYVYDRYPTGKPVPEAADGPGTPVFAAYRTNAPGTVAVYRHEFHYENTPNTGIRASLYADAMEPTDPSFELDPRADAGSCGTPQNSVPRETGQGRRYADAIHRTHSNSSIRAFWAFPVSAGPTIQGAAAVHEHRLEVDFMRNDNVFVARSRVYIKYSLNANGGSVFNECADATNLSSEPRDWWRFAKINVTPDGGGYQRIDYAYARYSNRIAFYAFPAK